VGGGARGGGGGGRDFPHLSRPFMGPSEPLVQWVPGVFSGVKAAGYGSHYSPPFSAKVKERVELYLYSPSGSSRLVVG
jgi:hypothetical protein